jgi:V8-like Glu-specific endopeptidase
MRGLSRRSSFLLGALTGVVLLAPAAVAQSGGSVAVSNGNVEASTTYWTPERLRAAQPSDLPTPSGPVQPLVQGEGLPAVKPQSGPSGLPTFTGKPSTLRLHAPLALAETGAGEVAPQAAGPLGARFTHARVVPLSVLRRIYPWLAIGKLFYTGADGRDYTCSASTLNRRVVVTAGHCVYDGALRRFHGNFLFVPGFDNGASPFGGFTWRFATTTGSWAAGGGRVPNAADFAMLVVNDKVVGGRLRRIGELTGWLGWRTLALVRNHVSFFGYPLNLDRAAIMQRTDAEVFRTVAPNAAEIGSDQTGGSSGGPWIQDFGVAAAGQPARALNGNVIVGIQSYGYRDPGRARVSGSSIPNAEFVAIFNLACNQGPGNCSY